MKIWVDLRFISQNIYSTFVIQLVEALIVNKKDDFFNIYTSKENKILISKKLKSIKNLKIQKIEFRKWSFSEQTKFNKILKRDANHLMVFFNQFKPIFYKNDYITFIWSLKDFYYSNFNSWKEKFIFNYLAEKNFKNSKKIIVLDSKTKDELIERFNIKSEKIDIISGFFPKDEVFSYDEKIPKTNLDIATKYNIKNPFFIYSGWSSIEKNYEKLVSVLHKLKQRWKNLDLVFLGNDISSNVVLRKLILEKDMQKNIFFLWELELDEKKYLYKESLWVIFPSFYEPFPFRLSEPLYFETQIISSELKKIKEIFWESISYFSPISENSILESLEKYLDENTSKKRVNYKEIKEKYNLENSLKEFEEIFDKV